MQRSSEDLEDMTTIFTCLVIDYEVLQSRRYQNIEVSRTYVEPACLLSTYYSLLHLGWVHDWLIRSSMGKGIHNRTSMGNVQNRTKFLPIVIIRTVAYLAMAVYWST